MTDRVKFDDEDVAKGKIASSPEITVSVPQRAKKPDGKPVASPLKPVEALKDDPDADARYSRTMGRLAARCGFDAEFAKEVEAWGGDLFPVLREVFRARPMGFRFAVGALIGAPAVIGGIRLLFKGIRKGDEKNDDGNA